MSSAVIIPFQVPLPQVLPTMEGNVDYREFRDQLLRINERLLQSGLETQFREADLKRWLGRRQHVSAPADSALLPRTVGRMEEAYGPTLKALAADRDFDGETNRVGLQEEGIYNAVCPRNPRQLKERNGSRKFKRLQRRRAQTEGRVGILKNVFWGRPMRSKGFGHWELTVAWTVLVHNLWLLAR